MISVGNLNVGGTGKSPMVAYLTALLKAHFRVGIVSRGYGRKTRQYHAVHENSTAQSVGDEPLMLKHKFPDVDISVDVERVSGIERLLVENPHINAVILDDAFQHRSVTPGLNILLTAYDDLFVDDFVLPAGRLRERRLNYKRANIIIVTKCPQGISIYDKKAIVEKIHPLAYQSVYFSSVKYADIVPLWGAKEVVQPYCVLVTGVADGKPLEGFLNAKFKAVSSCHFSDHHRFSMADLDRIRAMLNKSGVDKTAVVTTEKDVVRLLPFREWFEQNNISLYVQPITVDFGEEEGKKFDTAVLRFLNTFATEKYN